MKLIFAIAAGGAVGAVARHFVSHQMTAWLGYGFPWGTLTVNVCGSLAIGVLMETFALAWSPSEELRGFLVVGLLGALTTFSAFSLEVYELHARGATALAGVYVVVSVGLSIGALLTGLHITRTLLH